MEERRTLSDYLGDVAAEIQSNGRSIEIMETQLFAPEGRVTRARRGLLRDPNAQAVDTAALVAALALSAGPIRPWITDDRYQALRSSGTLRLLRDPAVAADLAGFHQGPAVLFDQADALRGSYQLAVNQIVPIELADDMSWMRGYADLEPDLFTGTPSFDMALQELRARREELLVLAQGEAAYAAAYRYALRRYTANSESMLASLQPWVSASARDDSAN